MFSAFYIWGLGHCADFYALLDCTLPFFFASIFSVIGFGIAQHSYIAKSEAEAHCAKNDKCRNYERRYIIKTYGRNGSINVKHINMRGNYGLLKSA